MSVMNRRQYHIQLIGMANVNDRSARSRLQKDFRSRAYLVIGNIPWLGVSYHRFAQRATVQTPVADFRYGDRMRPEGGFQRAHPSRSSFQLKRPDFSVRVGVNRCDSVLIGFSR